jgi:hypothetical protein
MAFKKAQFGSKNPTGDKAFNAITKNTFGPDAMGKSPKTEKPAAKKKPAGPAYDTATNTYRSNC